MSEDDSDLTPMVKYRFDWCPALGVDKLTICYDLSGSSRPTEFKTSPNTKLFLVTHERKKTD